MEKQKKWNESIFNSFKLFRFAAGFQTDTNRLVFESIYVTLLEISKMMISCLFNMFKSTTVKRLLALYESPCAGTRSWLGPVTSWSPF